MESHTNNNTTNLPSMQRSIKSNSSNNTLTQSHGKGEKHGRGGMNAESVLKPSDMYLVLPSYAEPHKKAIKNILAAEKAKICNNNNQLKTCFENIEFKIAFANSKNIKHLIVRTKI